MKNVDICCISNKTFCYYTIDPDRAIFHMFITGCAKINYAPLTGHDKSYTGPILKIFDSISSWDHQLDAIISYIFSLLFMKL